MVKELRANKKIDNATYNWQKQDLRRKARLVFIAYDLVRRNKAPTWAKPGEASSATKVISKLLGDKLAMYVMVNKLLPDIQKGIQAAHAVHTLCLSEQTYSQKKVLEIWNKYSPTLVLVKMPESIHAWMTGERPTIEGLDWDKIPNQQFYDTDLKMLTAIAIGPLIKQDNPLKGLSLA